MGVRLKKNLHYFDKNALFEELVLVNKWYDTCELLRGVVIDYRIKSIQSAMMKYDRYYPDHQTAKVFNDMLGFRTLCDSYGEILDMAALDKIRVADMTGGKAKDDGYRGVHVYFQMSSFHYPIEIQYNTFYDNGRQGGERQQMPSLPKIMIFLYICLSYFLSSIYFISS